MVTMSETHRTHVFITAGSAANSRDNIRFDCYTTYTKLSESEYAELAALSGYLVDRNTHVPTTGYLRFLELLKPSLVANDPAYLCSTNGSSTDTANFTLFRVWCREIGIYLADNYLDDSNAEQYRTAYTEDYLMGTSIDYSQSGGSSSNIVPAGVFGFWIAGSYRNTTATVGYFFERSELSDGVRGKYGIFFLKLQNWRNDVFNVEPGIHLSTSDAEDAFMQSLVEYTPTADDPYAGAGTSGPGGYGDGTFDFSSTPVDWQGAPTIGAMDTGMINLYVPQTANLQALSAYLWAGAMDPNNFKKLVADPMDAIIGLQIVPLTTAEIGYTSDTLAVGNISTGLSFPRANKQYVVVDCGSVSLPPKYGAYLDFAPYTKLQLFLPYIGYVDIAPEDCVNGTIAVKYTVDILSGTCVAQVKCNSSVLYEFNASCSVQCPVTAGQYQNIAIAAIRTAGAVASIAGGAASHNAAAIAQGALDLTDTVLDTIKPNIQRSGGFGASGGIMGHQIPYLIMTIPRLCRPANQVHTIGYPSWVELELSEISGYASVQKIHLTDMPGASDADLAEIEQQLKEGVYL